MARVRGFILYRIYYEGGGLVYVGRTKQPLQDRLRGHFYQKPMHRTIWIDQVSKIEYATFKTEADMNLYEIYYILTLKPPLNVDDKTKDYPTVTLPEVTWKEWKDPIFDKWKMDLLEREEQNQKDRRRLYAIPEEMRIVKGMRRTGQITEDECFDRIDALRNEETELRKRLYG